MTTQAQIDQFMANQPIAIAGVSRNPKKFGRMAFDELQRKGLEVIPINPNINSINGTACYPNVSSLPAGTDSLVIITPKGKTASIVEEALSIGIKNIWIQQSSDTPEALALLKDKGINLITGQCIFMHYKPNGLHKFHRNIKRFFGAMPR